MIFSKDCKVVRGLAGVVAGTSDQYTSVIDTAGFQGIAFMFLFGAVTTGAVTSVKVQQDDANGTSGMADLEGTAITVADTATGLMVIADVYRPKKRYVRAVIDRGTQNAVIDGIVAVLYDPIAQPVTHDATTVAGSELNISPAEGTA